MRVFRRFGEVRLSDDIDGFMKLVGDELMCGENTTTGEVFTPLQLQQQKSDSVRLAAATRVSKRLRHYLCRLPR